jgi:hypothetical protein
MRLLGLIQTLCICSCALPIRLTFLFHTVRNNFRFPLQSYCNIGNIAPFFNHPVQQRPSNHPGFSQVRHTNGMTSDLPATVPPLRRL